MKTSATETDLFNLRVLGLDAGYILKLPPFVVKGDAHATSSEYVYDKIVLGTLDGKETEAESQKFIDTVEQAIAKNQTISRKLAHSIIIGPPSSGKSSLIDRLLKRVRRISKSTGVCDTVIVVDIDEISPSVLHSATGMDSETWKEVDYEVSIVNQLGGQSKEGITEGKSKESKSKEGQNKEERSEEATLQSVSRNDVRPMPSEFQPPKQKSPPSEVSNKEITQKEIPDLQMSMLFSSKKKAVAAVTLSKKSVLSIIEEYGYDTFKNYLQKTFSLYLRDTGGHVEFQEMLPLLISGPSIFIFVFRIDLDFQSRFSIEYRKGESESINCYTSSITTQEAFLQSLASVYAMDTPDKDTVKTHKPLVFIVGTHIDRLHSSANARIAELNQHIISLIEKNGFQDLVLYADNRKGQIFFPVNNTSDSEDDFEFIRSKVNTLINGRKEFTIDYPVSYLLLCLDLQNVKKSIITLDEFKILAAEHGIEGDDVFCLLHFLHLRIGIIRYYDVDGLRDIVVIEPQVLFNTITDLVIRTFSCEALTRREMDEFERKGLMSPSVLETVINNEEMKGILPASAFKGKCFSDDKISSETFLQLLVHLRIITPIATPEDEEMKYFIPCVLNHVPESSGDVETDILPLHVKFHCHHCPKGVFGVLVTHLMNPDVSKQNDTNTTFSLVQDKIYRDQVTFDVTCNGFRDEMSISVNSSWLKLNFIPYSPNNRVAFPTKVVCCNVRQIVEDSIGRSLSDLHYSNKKVKSETCLKCDHCHELHRVSKVEEFHRLSCSSTRNNDRIPSQGRCWYGEGE